MKITLNNRPEEFPGKEQMSIRELLDFKNFTFKFLAVRINGVPIKPSEFDKAFFKNGDTVFVLHLISGG